MIGTGLTLLTNVTKHSTQMPNVARLNALLISGPVNCPFAPMQPTSLSSTRRVATTLFLRRYRYAAGGDRRGGERRRRGGRGLLRRDHVRSQIDAQRLRDAGT